MLNLRPPYGGRILKNHSMQIILVEQLRETQLLLFCAEVPA